GRVSIEREIMDNVNQLPLANLDTEPWPYIKAAFQTPVSGRRDVRVIVLHAMEAPEKGDTARSVGNYFASGKARASAHIGVDSNEIIQYVYDNNVAWAAPGVNHDGIHIEHAGYSAQTESQ